MGRPPQWWIWPDPTTSSVAGIISRWAVLGDPFPFDKDYSWSSISMEARKSVLTVCGSYSAPNGWRSRCRRAQLSCSAPWAELWNGCPCEIML